MPTYHRQQCRWFSVMSNNPNTPMNSLPFKPGDWVKIIKKPKEAQGLLKGDVIQVEQVSPSRQMIALFHQLSFKLCDTRSDTPVASRFENVKC